MKNIATDLELNGKPSYGCHENNYFHGDVCVMGRVNIDKIPKISKEDEYSVNPNVVPKAKLLPGKASTTFECQCGKNNIGESRISANNISTTSLPTYLCWEDAYRKVCEKGHEIRPAFWNSTIGSSGSTEKFSCSGARFKKLCMSNGNAGAETRRMVRSASLVFDLCPKSDHLDICSDDVTHIAGSKTSDVSLTEVVGKCNYTASGRIGENSHSNAGTIRRASVPSYCGALAPKSTSLPLTLTAALERIPLAYNPQTKQLHIISVNPVSNQKYTAVEKNSASNTDLQSEHGLKCFDTSQTTESTKEAQNDSCKFLGRRSTHCQLSHANNDSHSGVGTHEEYSRATLRRVSTSGSLPSRAECSSFSSISSLSTEFSVSATSAFEDVTSEGGGKSGSILDSDEANFIEINLDHPPVRPLVQDSIQNGPTIDGHCASTQGAKPKRRGISGFLSRNLLSWKSSKEASFHNDGAPGWNFFMRTQPIRDPNKVIQDYHERQGNTPANSDLSEDGCVSPRSRRSEDLVASSTTALILENRPSNLPAKAPEEELKHRLQYTQMVEAAKKKELKEAKLKKKLLQQQLRHEEQLSLASKIWNNEILPSWDTMKQSRKTKDLWWRGIPPSVRGKVWKLAIGNDLHITPELYEICVCRAKDRIRMAAECISVSEDDTEDLDKEASVKLIKLDVSRTFPQLCIFQKGGPYYDMLHSLLGAYVCYRPDVGYVQGMSFLAAVLILNLEVADAFICFANLLNQPCQLAFFRLDEPMMKSYFLTYEEFFKENMPKLFNHFTRQHLSPDLYLIDWIYTLYSRSLPLDVASRVWDVFFRDGDEFLFRTALGILRLYEDILLNLDFIHLAQFLTKLPEDIAAGPLFKSIECIRMVSEKRSFSQVLLNYAELQQT